MVKEKTTFAVGIFLGGKLEDFPAAGIDNLRIFMVMFITMHYFKEVVFVINVFKSHFCITICQIWVYFAGMNLTI